MGNVLIVGNITKDVYLRLDERRNKFEVDEAGVSWLDVGFDGKSHRYFSRLGVFGGAVVTMEVLSKFGVKATIAGEQVGYGDGAVMVSGRPRATYRYILCHGEEIAYFSPTERSVTVWEAPEERVDWVYIDRSATIDKELADGVLEYLAGAEGTRLAVYLDKNTDTFAEPIRAVCAGADLVFTEVEVGCSASVCAVNVDSIEYDGASVGWKAEREDFTTHLTTRSIIAASVLGAMILGKPAREAVLLAKANVENATLNGTINIKKLEELIMDMDNHAEPVEEAGGEIEVAPDSRLATEEELEG